MGIEPASEAWEALNMLIPFSAVARHLDAKLNR